MTKSPAREKLLQTALALFHQNGFHNTGIDRILAEAGVSKMTLYKHFRSKEELILAVLCRRDELFRDWLAQGVEARAEKPADRLLAMFDLLGEWFSAPDFHGCLFINATAEFSRPGDPVRAAAARHKALLHSWLTGIAAAAGADDPAALARELLLLKEGAIVSAQVSGDPGAARLARQLAVGLVARRIATA